jgi:hypothetical protein
MMLGWCPSTNRLLAGQGRRKWVQTSTDCLVSLSSRGTASQPASASDGWCRLEQRRRYGGKQQPDPQTRTAALSGGGNQVGRPALVTK